VQSAGLWGTITALVAVDESGSRITGIDFVSHSETPGLGGRIDEESFKEQFRGELISSDSSARVAVVSGQDTASKDDSKVDAITGATRTSESIQVLLNKAVNTVFPVVLEVVD
jgi:Na+-transporting NADH:ubiquinone oxidoreductase subunit C